MKSIVLALILIFSGLLTGCKPQTGNENTTEYLNEGWAFGPFIKADSENPILTPTSEGMFFCPLQQQAVRWQLKDVFNPAALIRDQAVYMLYRAEDTVGIYAGTSRLGLATSTDGLHFERKENPVFYPDNDEMKKYEWEGGCEDPRIVEAPDGTYIMTYTAWDGTTARLAVAGSSDLSKWTKYGLVLGDYKNAKYEDLWSKSGAIITEMKGNRLVAARVDGLFRMYWGDTKIYMASSDDLIHWEPEEDSTGALLVIFGPRKGFFDSDLVEPGPPPVLTDQGIVMIYNSRNSGEQGDPDLPPGTYSAGQILFDRKDPGRIIARMNQPFFKPENDYEITGQVNNVCFVEALVPFNDLWFLYYGTADSRIAAAYCTQ